MNLLFHEKIKKEQYKDRLAEAAHWRLVKQNKPENTKSYKSRFRSSLKQSLENRCLDRYSLDHILYE